MPKIENVIKALECCQSERQCNICPYNSHGADDCDEMLLFDAARLLKKHNDLFKWMAKRLSSQLCNNEVTINYLKCWLEENGY